MTDELMIDPPKCVACHRVQPPGGCKLTEEYEWLCRRRVECAQEIARQLREGDRQADEL